MSGSPHGWDPRFLGPKFYKPSRLDASGAFAFIAAKSSGQNFKPYPIAVSL